MQKRSFEEYFIVFLEINMLRVIGNSQHGFVCHLVLNLLPRNSSTELLQSHLLAPSQAYRQFSATREKSTIICKRNASTSEENDKKKATKESKKGAKKAKALAECKEAEDEALSKKGGEDDTVEHGGSCPSRLQQKPHVTLRPEDATAAACAAKIAEAAARRAALAKRPTAPRRKKSEEPVVRERLCARPNETESGFWRLKPKSVPKEERLQPQPTGRWVESLDEVRDSQRRRSNIAQAYRPTTVPIRVCTPKEVRDLFTPPPETPRVIHKKKGLLRRIISWTFLFTAKATIAAMVIWITIDLGIWENSDSAAELFRFWTVGDRNQLPEGKNLVHKMKDTWNSGVRKTFYFIGRFIPEFTNRTVKGVKTEIRHAKALETT